MSCNHNHNSTYFTNLVSAARQNTKERSRVVKGDYMRVNVMCIPMRGSIGAEVHEAEDQLITVVYGCAVVKLGNTQREADCVRRLIPGDSVFIPAGVWHNVCNAGNSPLKLISAYGTSAQNATGDCGCSQAAVASETQNYGCGCAQETSAYNSSNNCNASVFNAGEYRWNTVQAQDEGCGCAINSGC